MTFRELQNLDYAKFIENNKEEVTEMNESQMKCSICHRPLEPGENYNLQLKNVAVVELVTEK